RAGSRVSIRRRAARPRDTCSRRERLVCGLRFSRRRGDSTRLDGRFPVRRLVHPGRRHDLDCCSDASEEGAGILALTRLAVAADSRAHSLFADDRVGRTNILQLPEDGREVRLIDVDREGQAVPESRAVTQRTVHGDVPRPTSARPRARRLHRATNSSSMSEFSRYLLLREDVDVVAAFVERERATALVLQNQHGFTVLASPQHDAFVASDRFLWISYDFAADHGFVLEVFEKGARVARLKASSEVERTSKFERSGFVVRTLLSARSSVAINARLEKGDWTHRDIRDLVAREMGFEPVAFLSGGQLLDSRDDLEMRFPEGRLFIDGKVVEREDPLDGVDAILDAEKKAPASSRGKPKLTRVVMGRREMDEIASAFKNAA